MVHPSATAGPVGLAAQNRPFNLEIAVLIEWLRHIDDQKIGEQQLGQRMSTFRVKRPISLAVKTVIERHAAVEAGAIRAEIIRPKLEAVLFTVEITDIEVAIHGVGGFVHHNEVLDLGTTDAIEARAKRTVGRRLGDHCDERPSMRAE